MKIAFIEIVPMPSCFRQIGVCCVYTYREFALIYCAQLVLAKLARCSDHVWSYIFRFSEVEAFRYINMFLAKILCVKKIFPACNCHISLEYNRLSYSIKATSNHVKPQNFRRGLHPLTPPLEGPQTSSSFSRQRKNPYFYFCRVVNTPLNLGQVKSNLIHNTSCTGHRLLLNGIFSFHGKESSESVQ